MSQDVRPGQPQGAATGAGALAVRQRSRGLRGCPAQQNQRSGPAVPLASAAVTARPSDATAPGSTSTLLSFSRAWKSSWGFPPAPPRTVQRLSIRFVLDNKEPAHGGVVTGT